MTTSRELFRALFEEQEGMKLRSAQLVKPSTLVLDFVTEADATQIFERLQGNPALWVRRHAQRPTRLRISHVHRKAD